MKPILQVARAVLLCLGVGAVAAAQDDSARIQELVQQGKLDDALSATNAELEGDTASVTYWFLKGSILARMNRLDEAAAIFQKLTDEHPELPEPYNNLAVVYAAQGDFEKARQALQKAINTHPSYATAHENLGDIYAKMASQAYNHALQLDQDNSAAKAKLSLITNLFSEPQAGQVSVARAAPVKTPEPAPADTTVAASPAPKPARETAVEKPAEPVKAPATPGTRPAAPADAAGTTAGTPAAAPVARPPPSVAGTIASAPAAAPATAIAATTTSTPASVQAAAPAPAVASAAAAEDPAAGLDAVRRSVDLWATAWASQDADAYLAWYAEDFTPANGMPRDRWAAWRRERLAAPRFIKVAIADIDVAMMGADHAQATFMQDYRSDSINDRIRKVLLLKKVGDRWLITQETIR